MHNLKVLITAMWCIVTGACLGQSITPTLISSAGSQTLFQEVNIHWSVGELAVSQNNSGVNISEGFHQANIILTNVLDVTPVFGIKLFPNPARSYINVQHSGHTALSLTLYTNDGSLVVSKSNVNSRDQVDVSQLLPGLYIIMFSDQYGHRESHKISIQ